MKKFIFPRTKQVTSRRAYVPWSLCVSRFQQMLKKISSSPIDLIAMERYAFRQQASGSATNAHSRSLFYLQIFYFALRIRLLHRIASFSLWKGGTTPFHPKFFLFSSRMRGGDTGKKSNSMQKSYPSEINEIKDFWVE